MLEISEFHLVEIKEHSKRDYPYECCGIIFGKFSNESKKVLEILSIENEKEDESKHNRYLISSKKIFEAEVYAAKNDLDIVGFYHSHPDHSANPSAFDQEYALPVYSYLIVSVNKGEVGEFTLSVLSNDRKNFEKEEIKVV